MGLGEEGDSTLKTMLSGRNMVWPIVHIRTTYKYHQLPGPELESSVTLVSPPCECRPAVWVILFQNLDSWVRERTNEDPSCLYF